MYEQYEKQRTDDITDPDVRLACPISTISGLEPDDNQNPKKDNNSIYYGKYPNAESNSPEAVVGYDQKNGSDGFYSICKASYKKTIVEDILEELLSDSVIIGLNKIQNRLVKKKSNQDVDSTVSNILNELISNLPIVKKVKPKMTQDEKKPTGIELNF